MIATPLVSIITSCYNHELYLDDYFNGLLNQTYRNIELILIDDGSTDRSWDIIQTYLPRLQKAFPCVICERHENIGAILEWARGVEFATGKYLCFHDSDDYYHPAKIDENVRYLEGHPEVGLVHSDNDQIWAPDRIEHSIKATRNRDVPVGNVLEKLLQINFVSTVTACCRTELIKRHVKVRQFYERGYMGADYPIWLILAKHSQFGYIPKSLCCYRVRPESSCRSKSPLFNYRFAKCLNQMKMDFIREYSISAPCVEKILYELYTVLFYRGYSLLQKDDCLEGYRWLSANYPNEFVNWKQRLRMLLIRNQRVWKSVRWLEKRSILRSLLGDYEESAMTTGPWFEQ